MAIARTEIGIPRPLFICAYKLLYMPVFTFCKFGNWIVSNRLFGIVGKFGKTIVITSVYIRLCVCTDLHFGHCSFALSSCRLRFSIAPAFILSEISVWQYVLIKKRLRISLTNQWMLHFIAIKCLTIMLNTRFECKAFEIAPTPCKLAFRI